MKTTLRESNPTHRPVLRLGFVPLTDCAPLVMARELGLFLWRRGVRDGATLREEIRRARGKKMFTFGVVYPFSSHNYLLRNWLGALGIHPDREARIVVVPPPQMVTNLRAGNIDGFCAGEPWTSVAVHRGVGWCVAVSAELDPCHPEKVLMVRREFAGRREEEHLALVAALLEACEFCDSPQNREQLIRTLARPEYVGVPEAALKPGIGGEFNFGHGQTRAVPNFNVFHRNNANEPSDEKAAWAIRHIRSSGLGLAKEMPVPAAAFGRRIFRADLFEKANQLRSQTILNHENESLAEP